MNTLAIRSFLAAAALAGWCGSAAAQNSVPGPFSQDQVDAGRDHFAKNCAECHGKDLSGASAPALAGKTFVARWSNKTTADLYKLIQTTMPLCQGGLLANDTYAEIVAYLLWANGAQPGPSDFDGKTAVSISGIASGTVRPDVAASK